MPLLYYHSVKNAEIALWKATEETEFYKDRLLTQDFPVDAGVQIKHPEKAKQWYASRYLLCEIYPAAIQLYNNRKPYLFNGPEISFTHSGDVVGVMISQFHSGMDVQWVDPKLKTISSRFLRDGDLDKVKTEDEIIALSIIWAIKEAVFKVYGTQMAFKKIEIESYDPVSDRAVAIAHRMGKSTKHNLTVAFIDGLSLAYVLE